jgi:hypothetical protein
MVFDAVPPFAVLKVIDSGPIRNHVNFVRGAQSSLRTWRSAGSTR